MRGHLSLHQIKRTGQRGRGLGIAGLALGYVALATLLSLAIIVLLLNWLLSAAYSP